MLNSTVRTLVLTLGIACVAGNGSMALGCWFPFHPWGGYGTYYRPYSGGMYGSYRPYYPAPPVYSAGYYSAGYYGTWSSGYASGCCAPACCNPCDPCSACGTGSCAGGGCGVPAGGGSLKPEADPNTSGESSRRRDPEPPPRTYDEPRSRSTDPVDDPRFGSPADDRDPVDDFGRSTDDDGVGVPPVDDPGAEFGSGSDSSRPFDDILNDNRGLIEPFGEEGTRSSNRPPMSEPVDPGSGDSSAPPAGSDSQQPATGSDDASAGNNGAGGTGNETGSGGNGGTGDDSQSFLSIPDNDSLTQQRGTHHEVMSHTRFAGSRALTSPAERELAEQPRSTPVRWISAPSAANVVRL